MTPDRLLPIVWSVWALSWWAAAAWSKKAVKRPPAKSEMLHRLVTAAGAVLLFGVYRSRFNSEPSSWTLATYAQWSLFAGAVIGFAFAWWARIHIGRLWSGSVGRKEDHHVVDRGPYALVRHPIYTGIILAAVCTALLRGVPLAFVGVALIITGLYIKARMEEAFLVQELGTSYDTYARRVPMLVPFMRR
jgi:protein-S-isoprenylcysteine O-methyltransferase Ste14